MLLSSGDCDPFFARWLLGEAVKAAGQACSSATAIERVVVSPGWFVTWNQKISLSISLTVYKYISKSSWYRFPGNISAAGMVPCSWSVPWCSCCFSGNWQPTLGAASSAGNNSVWFLFVSRDNTPLMGCSRGEGASFVWQCGHGRWLIGHDKPRGQWGEKGDLQGLAACISHTTEKMYFKDVINFSALPWIYHSVMKKEDILIEVFPRMMWSPLY